MISSDFLVIGSGIAGLIYALDVAEHGSVTVLCKAEAIEGNTQYAQGGIASVTDPNDSFEAHIQDTLICGAGLCHEDIVRLVVTDANHVIDRLTAAGAQFDQNDANGSYQLGQEAGHSARRILHVGDATGAEIIRAVYARANAHPRIKVLTHHIAIDLVAREEAGQPREVIGAYALDKRTGAVVALKARATLIATGGVGKVYLYTSNPDVATGDGIAMAYRAGATLGNMEFIQFHPTCLYHPAAKSFLLTEALRGEGAILRTVGGERFMSRYHPAAELAPRDIVARAIDDVMKKSGDEYVLLDISHRDADFIQTRFPTIYSRTKEFGFDITKAPVPVVPAAHYCCGGIRTDAWGRTDLTRLYCAGEAAFTGLHGANRLASNSLLEAIVFAERAAKQTIAELSQLSVPAAFPEWDPVGSVKSPEEVFVSYTWDEVRRIMWNLVGIVRSDKRLEGAKRRIQLIKEEVREYYWRYQVSSDLIELRNILHIAEVIIAAAANRRESRGLHWSIDCPVADGDASPRDTLLQIGPGATPKII